MAWRVLDASHDALKATLIGIIGKDAVTCGTTDEAVSSAKVVSVRCAQCCARCVSKRS